MPRADHADALDGVLGGRVEADATCNEWLQRWQIVNHECDLVLTGRDVAELACSKHRIARPTYPQGVALDLESDGRDVGLTVRRDGGRERASGWLRR